MNILLPFNNVRLVTASRPFARHAQPNNLAGRLSIFTLCGDTSCNLLNRSSKLGHAWASLCNAFAVTPLVIGLNVNFHGFAGG